MVREGGGDGDGYGRVAAVASGGQRRREAAIKKATSMTLGAAAAANDGNDGSNCGNGDSAACGRSSLLRSWSSNLQRCVALWEFIP